MYSQWSLVETDGEPLRTSDSPRPCLSQPKCGNFCLSEKGMVRNATTAD